MFAVTIEAGMLLSPTDVCLTPAGPDLVPVPYPNIAQPELGDPVCDKVLICGSPALSKSSTIKLTDGDQSGVGGGVMSGRIMGEATFIEGSRKVKLQGNPAVRLTASTSHNANNCVGACLAPSQTVVVIME
jgi:hypothetical protein